MRKAYSVTLDPELVDIIRKQPETSLSGLLNRLLKQWIEETEK